MPFPDPNLPYERQYDSLHQIWKHFNEFASENEKLKPANGLNPTFDELKTFINDRITSKNFRRQMFEFNGTVFPGYEADQKDFDNEAENTNDSGINEVQMADISAGSSGTESDDQIITEIEKYNRIHEELSKKVGKFLTESYKRFPPDEHELTKRTEEPQLTGKDLFEHVQKFLKDSEGRIERYKSVIASLSDTSKIPQNPEVGENYCNFYSNDDQSLDPEPVQEIIILLEDSAFEKNASFSIPSNSATVPKHEPISITETYNSQPSPVSESASRKEKNSIVEDNNQQSPQDEESNKKCLGKELFHQKQKRISSWNNDDANDSLSMNEIRKAMSGSLNKPPEKEKKQSSKERSSPEKRKIKKNRLNDGNPKKNKSSITDFLDPSDVDDEEYISKPRTFLDQGLNLDSTESSDGGSDFDVKDSEIMEGAEKEFRLSISFEKEMKRLHHPKDEPIPPGRRKTMNSSFSRTPTKSKRKWTESMVLRSLDKLILGDKKKFPRGHDVEVLIKCTDKEAYRYVYEETVENYKIYTCKHCSAQGRNVVAIYQIREGYCRYDSNHVESCTTVPW